MKRKLLTEAMRIAQQELPKREADCWLHWSFIIVNDKIIEWGHNMRGNPPIHMGYNKKIIDVEYPALLHSEIVAYRRASKLLGKELVCFDIINVRLNKHGQVKISAPCKCCYPLLKELGAHKFYFTTESGWGKVA